jgi:pseudouridine synthase
MPSSRKPRSSAAREVHPSLAQYRQKERGERLQKVLADAGVAARRECEKLIIEGAVTVNGKTIDTLPAWADPKADRIEVFGKPLRPAEEHVYVMLFKPRGTVCTNSDPEGRPRAIDLVNHPARARLYCVGRLDLDASGLLILTNDGEFANRLTHPRYEVTKGYEVTLDGRLDPEAIAQIERRIFAASAGSRGKDATGADHRSSLQLVKTDAEKSVVHLELCEHRNLQIKDLMLSLGHPVKKMRRTSFGPLKLKGLAVGEWRELTGREIEMLRRASRGLPTSGADGASTPARRAGRERPRADLLRTPKVAGAGGPAKKGDRTNARDVKTRGVTTAATRGPRATGRSGAEARGFEQRGFEARGFEARGFETRGFETRGFETRGSEARGSAPRGSDRARGGTGKQTPVKPAAEARPIMHPAAKAAAAAAAAAAATAKPTRASAGTQAVRKSAGGAPAGARPGGKAGGFKSGGFKSGAPKAGGFTGGSSRDGSPRSSAPSAGSFKGGSSRPGSFKPSGGKPSGGRPTGGKPGAFKSGGGKPGSFKSGSFKTGPAKSGARGGGPRRERRP